MNTSDKPKEECGIFGIFGPNQDVARITYFGLYALQHRGQESAGIATTNGEDILLRRGMGLVSQVFNEPILEDLKGFFAIGHNRYSTTGSSDSENAAPIIENSGLGQFAIAHNGNITNSIELKTLLSKDKTTFYTTTDSEIIAKTIAKSPGKTFEAKIKKAVKNIYGAYSIVLLTKNQLFAFRDKLGVRPLCIGKLNGGWVFASESCALSTVGAEFIREIKPGEIVSIDMDGKIKSSFFEKGKSGFCVFEYIYFARPDSILNNRLVYSVREQLGRFLAVEEPIKADMVIGAPDSATPAAIGYSKESDIVYREGLIKNRYIGRTFIEPDQRLREIGIKLKLNPLKEVIKNKNIILVDDSIIRGNTTGKVVRLLKNAGAKKVHVRITSPPMKFPCFFGVDTATKEELIAHRMSISQIRDFVYADSLYYLSLKNLIRATKLASNKLCLACFDGEYLEAIHGKQSKFSLEEVGNKD